ncbi:MAG: hypothetical protein N3D75_02930 [Candidatus Aenigmarchaeota archaeon]|nr:hypothetical protein [Candidatus Aenigmarchaeota archaeon]
MSKAVKVFVGFVIISLILILSLYAIYKNKQSSDTGKILFFYGITCPHCKNVEVFIEQNNLDVKLKIESLEVYNNRANLNKMISYASKCGINENNLGVPMIYYDGKCYVGDKDCIDLLKVLGDVE